VSEPIAADAAPQNRQRILVIAAAVLVAALAAYLLFNVVGGGSSSTTATSTTLGATGVTPVPRATTTTTIARAPAESFEVFSSKNPFVPLRGTPTAGATTTGATTTGSTSGTSSGGTSSGTTGTTSGTTSSGTTSSGTVSGAGTTSAGGTSSEPRQSQRVSLLDIFVEGGQVKANVKVNDTVYKVTAGQVFATSYKATSLSQSDGCGRFLFGDEPFRLCKGEEVLK
jgi:hypothetical protein